MSATEPRYSEEEFARRGDAVYDRDVAPAVGDRHTREFVAVTQLP
jgi:hypothetical protein